MTGRSLRVFSAIAIAATVAATLSAPATASPPPSAPPPGTTASAGTTITLVTGDQVSFGAAGPDGVRTMSVRMVRRADGSQPSYRTTEARGHQFVVPDDAQQLVSTGELDPALFDVTYLADHGYGDNATGQLPLIAQFAPSVATAKLNATADSLAGTSVTHALTSVHASAVRLTKASAGGFWSQLASKGRQAKSLAASKGVTKIWLDRKVRASLDQSVPMIGAPQAWAAGYTGKGVKVAVLDTGIDTHHPDFAGKIGATANFTPDASIEDGFGHGTHVASIITGSGAASGGKYRGVAPDVELMVGKVLPDAGEGPESAVIAGMEWAAAQGAKVVNLSLGGDAPPTYEQDLGAQAVDRLSATTSTLFVVAAGNSGLAGASTVGSPGNANAALTVGMVTKTDQLDPRSSTGPLLRDDHVGKPDISAPGVNIVAAKAGKAVIGEPVDDHYTKMSGTSMATPHVTGSAAILAQEHPDWTNQQLKSALMATSRDDGYTVYQQGAGRVDLVRATTQKVTGTTGSLDFGRKDENGSGKIDKAAGYRNDGDTPVTLTLTASLKAPNNADGGPALTMPASVTVPAHGTVTAIISLDSAKVTPGIYSGVVLATAAGGVQVRTPIALRVSPPVYPVTIRMTFADQVFAGVNLYVYNLDDPLEQLPNATSMRPVFAPDYRSASLSVPLWRGHWMVGVMHQTLSGSNGHIASYVLVNPEVTVTGPADIQLNDSDAKPLRTLTQRPSQNYAGGFGYRRAGATGDVAGQTMGIGVVDEAYVTPTKPVSVGKMSFKYDAVRGAPLATMNIDSKNGRGQPVALTYQTYAGDFRKLAGTHRRVPIVRVGSTIDPAEKPQLRGALALMEVPADSCEIPDEQLIAARDAGALGVLQNDGRMCFYPYGWGSAYVPLLNIDADVADALNALLDHGPVTVTYTGTPDTPYTYRLSYLLDGIPADPTFRVSDRKLASIPTTYHGDQDVAGVASSGVGMTPLGVHGKVVPIYWTYLNRPGTREELVGPVEPGMLWIRDASPSARTPTWEERRTPLRAGRMPAEHWLDAPRSIGPAEVSAAQSDNNDVRMGWCFACRRGDVLSVVPMYAHTDPVVTNGLQSVQGTRTTVYADGKPLPTAGNPILYQLPAQPARLKLVTDWDLNTGPLASQHLYQYGARQHGEWTFASSRPKTADIANTYCFQTFMDGKPDPCAVQRLLHLRFQVAGVGLTNKIRPGLNAMSVAPFYEPSAHPATARFRTVSVKLSFDGGKTWQRGYGWPAGDRYRLLFNAPATATSVSWQVDATDSYGNTVSQTSYDAVGVGR
ncbi:S8 family peptidase [Fodinicola acaciae]|uniref:S8 family peptidase n=1 Tax=Fodinicola acaciae TaxID=2681555 RepID=UPI0013D42AA5|nr:S8 family peptidase [Fodinicola acaciae]